MKFLIRLFFITFLIILPIKNSNAEESTNLSKIQYIKPLIDFQNDRCSLCNMYVDKKQFTSALVYHNNTLSFCDIGDLIIYQNKHKDKEYKAWVPDYNSEKLLEAEKSFFVITKSIRTPMGHGILAFEKESDALSFIKSNEGQIFKDFSSLTSNFMDSNKEHKMHKGKHSCNCGKMNQEKMKNCSCKKDAEQKVCSCGKMNGEQMKNCSCKNQKSISDSHHGHHLGFRGQPIGIMGAHTHHKGSLMASYNFMYMNMNGNLSGTNRVSKDDILKDFMFAPENMNMFMNMVGTMYSVTDDLTIMGMFPYISKSMTGSIAMNMGNNSGMNMPNNTISSMDVQGFGDIRIDALYNIFQNELHSVILRLGTSLPTGNINNKGDMHGSPNQQYPYPMQMGSGTFDLLTGITYTSGLSDWTWGGQINGNIRLGKNSNNYALGNSYNFTAWGGRRILNWLHSFVRVNLDTWDNISGKDTNMNEKMTPAARTDLRAGTKLDLFAGFNFILPDLFGKNNLGIEVGLPVYQNLTGPQPANNWYLNTGIQHLF